MKHSQLNERGEFMIFRREGMSGVGKFCVKVLINGWIESLGLEH
jgi:hypothetical protein